MSEFVPPPPPPPGDPRARSVAEHEGLVVDRGAYELGSQAWLSRALVSPIWQLGVQDLRLLVMHGRGLPHLMPVVLDRLEESPFVAGDHGPGELLLAACLVDDAYWHGHPAERDRMRIVLRMAQARLEELPDAATRAHWHDELVIARERFGD